ncbi:MAG: MFS transporter [Asgard group archaeon]|nr:MFS transporter [Asgard group archaeon]
MMRKQDLKLLMPINLFHTMAHIYPYFLPILCQFIRNDIPMNDTQVAMVGMTGILIMIPLTILIGYLGDKIAKWRLELIAVGFLLVFSHSFIIYIATTYQVLIIAAILSGIGASIFHPIALPLLSQEFGVNRNMAHSLNLIFGTFGSIITPIASMTISNWLGWRQTALIFGIAGGILFPILVTLLLLQKKNLQYQNQRAVVIGERVVLLDKDETKQKLKLRAKLAFITIPMIAIILAMIIRSGIFRIMNTFTGIIFEDRFEFTALRSAFIMSAVLGAGGISAFISGGISRRIGSLRTFVISKIATLVTAIALAIFIGTIDITGITIVDNLGLKIVSVLLFILLAASFYFGNPSANALLAEIMPLEVLSSVYGVVTSLMTGFSAVVPVIFGAISDRHFSLPYEYLIIIVLSIIPLLLLLYAKSKIGYKTPDEVENERAKNNNVSNESVTELAK